MDELDRLLARLAHAPIPATLDGLEAQVLDRLSTSPTSRAGVGIGAFAIIGALMMGVAGAGLPAASSAAGVPLSPFGSGLWLAPSTLLASMP